MLIPGRGASDSRKLAYPYRKAGASRYDLMGEFGRMSYRFQIEVERETDGRWIAEIPNLSGAMVYGKTKQDAVRAVRALALRVLADRIEHAQLF
jgi:predicted RNase H-like HicB family nuclease